MGPAPPRRLDAANIALSPPGFKERSSAPRNRLRCDAQDAGRHARLTAARSGVYTARSATANEGNIVDNMFESTGYIKEERFKRGLQASLVCYARAIEGPGWDAMGSG